MCSLDALSAAIDFTRSQDRNHKFVILGGAETWCCAQLNEAQNSMGQREANTKGCLSCRLNWLHNKSSPLILHLFLSLNRKGTNDKACYYC